MGKTFEKKYQDMETRLYRLYDEIEGVENSIEEVKNRLLNIRQQKISEENVYQFLLYFDKLYDKFTDLEKKEFLNSFVEQVSMCRHTLLQCTMSIVRGSLLLLNRGKDEAYGKATKMKRWQSTDMSPKEPLMHTTGHLSRISSVLSVRL